MTLELWLVYLLAATGLSLTPGPNGLLALTHGVRFGLRKTCATVLGGIVGFVLLIALSMSGLGVLLAASERVFGLVKWAGAAYLVYLGVRLWFAPPPLAGVELNARENNKGLPQGAADSFAARFRQGLLVALANPKALLFFAAFLPQFIVPGVSLGWQFVVLAGTFAMVELLYELLVAATAGRVAGWLARYGRSFNRLAGATFVLIGVLLARVER